MEYKVVSVSPSQKGSVNPQVLALEFESIINKYKMDGWQYVRIESLKVWVDKSGCFGLIGAGTGYYAEKQMIVFTK